VRGYALIQSPTKICASRSYDEMDGSVSRAVRCRILKFTINSFAAKLATMRKRT